MNHNRATWYRHLVGIGIALSAERDHQRMLERILEEAKSLSNADGGTLYLLDPASSTLSFKILRNDSLKLAYGGPHGQPMPIPPLPLYRHDGSPNESNVATYVALHGTVINIADAYDAAGFDFSGTRRFDASTGYRSKSFLTLPLRNHENTVIGVLQLINAQMSDGGVIPFNHDVQQLLEALASLAAVAITNEYLLSAQKRLFRSFIDVLANAVDAKSPYTGGHCQRVPVIARLLAQAACDQADGPFAGFNLSEDEWYELDVAAGLHDCGKITTPEYVIDKATKLEAIFDRIHVVRARFQVLKRDAEIAWLKGLATGGDPEALRRVHDATQRQLDDDLAFLELINLGGEFMAPDKLERLHRIAGLTWVDESGREVPVLTENEVYNLAIARGTLTAEERKVINDHIVVTIDMLRQLPFPKNMSRVVEIAGGHHEKMDGTGYPNRLGRDQLSIQARILAVADIFEALTAADRPYKKGKMLSDTIRIMAGMGKDRHIDPDLFDLLLRSGIYREYARQYMKPEQIDEVDVERYLNPAPALS